MGRKTLIKSPTPMSRIVGYRISPSSKKVYPISAKSLRVAKGNRRKTRSCTSPEFMYDPGSYSDIDSPDLLMGLHDPLQDYNIMPCDQALGVTDDTSPNDVGSQGRSLLSVTRDDIIEAPRVEGQDADVLISHDPLPYRCVDFAYPDDIFSGHTESDDQPDQPLAAGIPQLLPTVLVSQVDSTADLTLLPFVSANNTQDEVYSANCSGSSSLDSQISSEDLTLPSSSSKPGSKSSSPQPDIRFGRLSPIFNLSSLQGRPIFSPVPITSSIAAIMAPSDEEIATAITSFLRANDDWTDEYSEMIFEYLPATELSRLRSVFLSHKENLANCYHTVRAASVEILAKVGSLQAVADLKKSYIALIAKSFEFEHNRQREGMDRPRSRVGSEGGFSNDPSVSDSIRSSRVQGRTDAATQAANKICDDLRSLNLTSPSSHQELDNLEAKVESAKLQKNELLPELRDLAKAATASGLRDQAERLHDAIDTLSDCQRSAIDLVHQAKISLGVPISGGFQRPSFGSSKPPKFSGDFASEVDFFSFMELFQEYTSTMRIYSILDKFQRLKSDCLTGQARSAVSTCKTFDEAISLLRDLYGKSRVLFAHKEKEILQVGKCPSNTLDRRTWFINMHNRVVALQSLAETHNILDSFHTSSLFDTIVSFMTSEDRLLYKTRIIDQMAWDPDLDQSLKATVDRFVSFLGRMRHRSGLEVDYSISCFDKTDDVLRKMNALRPDHKAKSDKEKSGKAPDNPPSTTCYKVSSSTDTPSSSDMPVARGAEQAEAMAQAHAAPLPPIALQVPGDPVPVMCSVCNNEHTSMAYCSHFQKSRVKDRYDKCKLSAACVRCLRLDSKFEPGRRREWWDAHRPACNGDWACKEGDCATKPSYRQFHFTLCINHITSNKGRQAEFIDSLEPPTGDVPHRFF